MRENEVIERYTVSPKRIRWLVGLLRTNMNVTRPATFHSAQRRSQAFLNFKIIFCTSGTESRPLPNKKTKISLYPILGPYGGINNSNTNDNDYENDKIRLKTRGLLHYKVLFTEYGLK